MTEIRYCIECGAKIERKYYSSPPERTTCSRSCSSKRPKRRSLLANRKVDFWKNVDKTSDCWLWNSTKNNFGYGLYSVGGKFYQAHRLSYEWFVKPIPEGSCVLHHCDTPNCIRPSHLFLGDRNDNRQDSINKGRANGGGHKLTYRDAAKIRNLYAAGKYNQPELAELYDVGLISINRIITNKRYVR